MRVVDQERTPAGYDLELRLVDAMVRGFKAAAPAAGEFHPAIRHAVSARPVDGFVVGVTDGVGWGWWGPVPEDIAESARRLIRHPVRARQATPEEWAARLRRSTRHAHTGILSAARGALELASWDLLGQRHGVPVWRLLVDQPARDGIGSYATCFGVRLDAPDAPLVAQKVREVWRVQKWRPVQRLLRRHHPARRAAAVAGPAGLALDFGGAWSWPAARRLCTALPWRLAWMEEPCPVGEMATLEFGERPAPVAAGERCYGLDETTILEAARVDIWQADALFCGGLSALRAIAARAVAAGRRLVPHGGGLLPAIHAAIAGSVMEMVEYHLLLEPRRQRHLACPISPDSDGTLGVPQLPGWAGPLRLNL